MSSSGMLGRVALVKSDVSEEISATIIRVTRTVVIVYFFEACVGCQLRLALFLVHGYLLP
jgi:hypothetical protein